MSRGPLHPLVARAQAAGARLLAVLPWAPVLPALAYLAVLTAHLRSLIQDVNWNSDVLSPMVLAGTLPSVPDHPLIHLGSMGYYTTLWFDWVTRGLPAHRQLWEAAPYMVALFTLALLAWTSRRVAGRWAAVITFVIAFAVAPAVLFGQMAQAYRVTSWFSLALLGAFLVLLAARPMGWPALLAVAAAVASVTGLNLASDTSLFLGGVVPFVAAALIFAATHRGALGARLAGVALVTTAASAAIAGLATFLMYRAGFRTVSPLLYFATLDQIGGNISLLTTALLELGNGAFFGEPVGVHSAAIALAGLVTAAGLAMVVVALPRVLRTPQDRLPEAGLRLLLTAYWSISACLLIAAFATSTLPVDSSSVRYLIPLVYAAAVVIPLQARRSLTRRLVIAAGVTVVATMSVRGLQATARDHLWQYPLTRPLPAVAAFLESQGLRQGYAGYWYAHPLTWHTDGRVTVRPVAQGPDCQGDDAAAICPIHLNSISSWYGPSAAGGRTFVLQDPDGAYVRLAPSSALGPPSAVHRVGRMTIFVYPYDVASRFQLERRAHAPGTPRGAQEVGASAGR